LSGGLPDTTRQHPTQPPFVGWCRVLSGEVPDKSFCDKERHKPLLEGHLSGLSGGFSGGVVMPIDLEVLATLIEEDPGKGEKPQEEPPTPPQRPAPTGQEIRALWFRTPPRPLPPGVLKRVGAIPEVHGLQGCWNMAGNRLPYKS
jgi:hypothetical protein